VRLHLRPVSANDAPALFPWLVEAAAAVHGRGVPAQPDLTLDALLSDWDRAYPPGETLAGVLADGTVVGLLRAREPDTERLIVDALTVRAELRNRGYGQEMVFALEESWETPGGAVYAGVPRGNGLAIYFWLRTGYRPLYPAQHLPAEMNPALFWMTRRRGG
jgi:GNAT superfamily N-acetyltransferase